MARVSDEELARIRSRSRYPYVYIGGTGESNFAEGELVSLHDIIDDLRDARALADIYKDLCTAYRIGGGQGHRLADKALARLDKLREVDHAEGA